MTNYYIVLCSTNNNSTQYLYATNIDFSLKFEILYELNGKVAPEEAVKSKKIGFSLIKDGCGELNVYYKS